MEEAEWVGLKPWEAVVKQKNIEEEQLKANLKPLKEKFKEETYRKLLEGDTELLEKSVHSV